MGMNGPGQWMKEHYFGEKDLRIDNNPWDKIGGVLNPPVDGPNIGWTEDDWKEWIEKNSKKQEVVKDNVNNPAHYNHNRKGIEAIVAIEASMSADEFIGYLKGNIIKYLWRYRYKNGLEDLAKAIWYLNLLKEKYGEMKSV